MKFKTKVLVVPRRSSLDDGTDDGRHSNGKGHSMESSKHGEELSTISTTDSTTREPIPKPPKFTHALMSEKTLPNTLVSFDGPKDPYLPMNWSPKKKQWMGILAVVRSKARNDEMSKESDEQ